MIISGKCGNVVIGDGLEGMREIFGESGKVANSLVLTDPPYGVQTGALKEDFERLTGSINGNTGQYKNKEFYDDTIDDYPAFSRAWFQAASRFAEMVVFTPGSKNLNWWLNFKKPREVMIHYKPNCVSITHYCRFNQWEPILAYGKFGKFAFRSNVFVYPLVNAKIQELGLKHPNVKEYRLWLAIVERLNPEFVFDPFAGSGTTAEVCEELGILYICYESNPIYAGDIQKRIDAGIEANKVRERLRRVRIKGIL